MREGIAVIFVIHLPCSLGPATRWPGLFLCPLGFSAQRVLHIATGGSPGLLVKRGNATMRFVSTKDIELKQFFRGPIWQLRD